MKEQNEKELLLPKLRPEMTAAVLCAWLVDEGESFTEGEPLYEIETDKVVTQVEATFSGRLDKQLVSCGDEVGVESPVALASEE